MFSADFSQRAVGLDEPDVDDLDGCVLRQRRNDVIIDLVEEGVVEQSEAVDADHRRQRQERQRQQWHDALPRYRWIGKLLFFVFGLLPHTISSYRWISIRNRLLGCRTLPKTQNTSVWHRENRFDMDKTGLTLKFKQISYIYSNSKSRLEVIFMNITKSLSVLNDIFCFNKLF